MKINKKGLTLIELLVSISLISMVLIFLFWLLIDVKGEKDANDFAYDNQINRADAIYTIQNDLNTYTLVGINDNTKNDNVSIEFDYLGFDSPAKLSISRIGNKNAFNDTEYTYYLKYKDVEGNDNSWEMKGAIVDSCGKFTFYTDESNKYFFKLVFPIYNKVEHENNNSENNNYIDDIEITFKGDKNDLNNSSGLTTINKKNQQIGSCGN